MKERPNFKLDDIKEEKTDNIKPEIKGEIRLGTSQTPHDRTFCLTDCACESYCPKNTYQGDCSCDAICECDNYNDI